nr:hypothetical protein [Shimazuella alba]
MPLHTRGFQEQIHQQKEKSNVFREILADNKEISGTPTTTPNAYPAIRRPAAKRDTPRSFAMVGKILMRTNSVVPIPKEASANA